MPNQFELIDNEAVTIRISVNQLKRQIFWLQIKANLEKYKVQGM